MALTLILFVGSAVAIYLSCEFFVNGVEWVGQRLKITETATGTILAAFGTALPETVVTFVAVIFGNTDAERDIGVGAALGFFGAPRIGAKHEPVEFNAFRLLKHPQHCATTANLDIVAVRPHAQHPLHAIQIARNHFLISC